MSTKQNNNIKQSRPYMTVLVCNIIIAILCLSSILSYFLMPLQTTTLSITISEDILMDEYHDEFEEYFDDDEITISYPMELSATNTLLLAVKPEKVLANYITDNLNGLIDCAHDPLYKALQIHVENELEKDFITHIENKIQFQYNDTTLTAEQLKAIRQLAGITNKYVESCIDALMNAAFKNNLSGEELFLVAKSQFINAFERLRYCGDPNLYSIQFTEQNEEAVHDYLEIFYYDGETLAQQFSNTRRAKSSVKDILGDTRDFEKTLKDAMKTSTVIPIGLKVFAFTFLLSLISWVYVLIKVLAKFAFTNNGVKLKAPIICSFFPPLLFALIPSIAFSFLKNSLLSLIPESFEVFSVLAEGFKINFTSSAWIPLIIAFVLIVFTISFYGKQRKQVKALIRPTDDLADVQEEDYINMEVTDDEIEAVEMEAKAAEEAAIAQVATSQEPAVVEATPEVVETIPEPIVETPVAIEETPEVVEETPAAIEETPEVVEETPAAIEETPEVVEETPAVVEETTEE